LSNQLMPLPRVTRIVLALAFLAPFSRAQSQPRTERRPVSPVSLDLAVGAGNVRHGAYATAHGIDAEALVAGRFLARPNGSLIVAANGFLRAIGFGDDLECRFDASVPNGCYERAFLAPNAALLGGAELRRHGAALRLLAGPIRYNVEDASRRTGTHVRLDLAVPATSSIAFVLATRMSYLGRIRGEAIEIFGLSAGLRLQR